MSMIFQPHRIYARPTILSTVGLGILILKSGHNTSHPCVIKNSMEKPLISHNPVINWETTCQGWMQTCSDAPLGGLLDSVQGLLWSIFHLLDKVLELTCLPFVDWTLPRIGAESRRNKL